MNHANLEQQPRHNILCKIESCREEKKIHQNSALCVPHTRLRVKEARDSCYALSLPRLLSAAGAWHKSCNANVLFPFMWNQILLVIVPSLKIEADAQDVSYRVVCNWHVNKMKSECTTVNRFCWCWACVLSLETVWTDSLARASSRVAHVLQNTKIESDTLKTSFVCIDLLFVYYGSD